MNYLNQLTEGLEFEWEGHFFQLNAETLSFLHHWNFGTSTSYYKSKEKFLILPDRSGKLVKIKDINGALDEALATYNQFTLALLEKGNERE